MTRKKIDWAVFMAWTAISVFVFLELFFAVKAFSQTAKGEVVTVDAKAVQAKIEKETSVKVGGVTLSGVVMYQGYRIISDSKMDEIAKDEKEEAACNEQLKVARVSDIPTKTAVKPQEIVK